MIAVQTNDQLYLIKMDDAEFTNLVMQEYVAGRDIEERLIPLIRANSGISINNNNMIRFASSVIPEITTCFRRVGNRFDIKPVNSVDDLSFFMAPDGKQYSSEEAYSETLAPAQNVEASAVPDPVTGRVTVEEETTETLNQELGDFIPDPVTGRVTVGEEATETLEQELGDSIPDPVTGQVATEEEKSAPKVTILPPGREAIALPASLDSGFYKPASELGLVPYEEKKLETVDSTKIQIRESQKRAASQLDNIIRTLPNVANLPEEILRGIANLVNEERETFRGYASEYLGNVSPLDRNELLTSFPVPNALNASHDMADSLLVFPVYTSVLTKKNSKLAFSTLDLANSVMLRICPVGIDGDRVQGYVQEFRITRQDVKEAKEIVNAELKKKKRTRSLSSEEKYALYEDALEQIYRNRKGSLAASKETKLIADVDKYLSNLANTSKIYIPDIGTWSSYDVMAFDARVKEDQLPIPLLKQLQDINGKTMEEVQELVADANNRFLTDFDKMVKVRIVDTSEEAIKSGKTSVGFTEKQFSYLSDNEKEAVITSPDGSLLLSGFYEEKGTGKRITEEEFLARCERVRGRVIEGGPDEDPFEDDIEKTTKERMIKVHQVDTSAGLEFIDLGYIEVSEDSLIASEKSSIVETKDGFILEGYHLDIANNCILTDLEYQDIMNKKSTTEEETVDKLPEDTKITIVGLNDIPQLVPLSEIPFEVRKNIEQASDASWFLRGYFDPYTKEYSEQLDVINVPKVTLISGEKTIDKIPQKLFYSRIPEELRTQVVERNGMKWLDNFWFYDNSLITDEELKEIQQQEKAAYERAKREERNRFNAEHADEMVIISGLIDFERKIYANDFDGSVKIKFSDLPLEVQDQVFADEDNFLVFNHYYDVNTGKVVFVGVEELKNYEEKSKEVLEAKEAPEVTNHQNLSTLAGKASGESAPLIPNPETGLLESETESWKLPDRKFRQPIIAMIPTVFSKGATPEKLEKIENYMNRVPLSEDDMTDELKAAIRPTENGEYTLEGYCFDYDQVKLITEEEYLQLSLAQQGIPQESAPQPIGALKDATVVNANMGKPTEALESAPVAPKGEARSGDEAEASGKFIDPTGYEWSSEEEYNLYKMLTDESFLTDQEQNGKKR